MWYMCQIFFTQSAVVHEKTDLRKKKKKKKLFLDLYLNVNPDQKQISVSWLMNEVSSKFSWN